MKDVTVQRFNGSTVQRFAIVPLILLGTLAVWCTSCTNPFYPVFSGSERWYLDGLLVPERAGLYKKEGSPIAWRSVTDPAIHPDTNGYFDDVCDYLDGSGHAGEYLMLLGADITSPAVTMTTKTSGRERYLTIAGVGNTSKTIRFGAAMNSLVSIEAYNTLTLHRNIILRGHSGASRPLVTVMGSLFMEEDCAITGHTNATGFNGGGVYVNGGAFTMNGGSVSNNTMVDSFGGGVYMNGGMFTMNGGNISHNTSGTRGGGVYSDGGELILSGGTIAHNKVLRGSSFLGGGVYSNDHITIAGTTITGNEAVLGGGLYIDSGVVEMTNGRISGNRADRGGGIYIGPNPGGVFTKLNLGVIADNTSNAGQGQQAWIEGPGVRRDANVNDGEILDSGRPDASGGWTL